jgi:uncharacterized tellurite resistance protein B-like protein
MADWKKVALAAILADGKIDEAEVKVLKKELWADGKIDNEEVKFLIELRNTAQKKAKAKKEELTPAFNKLFFKALSDNVLKDGKIDATEAKWLREMLFADGKIDAGEWAFVEELNKKAKTKSPEFEALYAEVKKAAEKAKIIPPAPKPEKPAEKPAEKAEKPAEKAEKPEPAAAAKE